MITEDYVGFETAKLLKEKGFDYYPDGSYWLIDANNVMYFVSEIGAYDYVDVPTESFQRPKNGYRLVTQAMAMKWLREEQNLFIEIQCYGCEADKKAHFEYSYVISEFVKIDNKICTVVGLKEKKAKAKFSSYEEACEAAIKYCLENLI